MNERFFCVSSELSESTECEIGFFSIRPPNGFEQLENPALSLEQLQEAFALAAKATEQDVLVKLPNLKKKKKRKKEKKKEKKKKKKEKKRKKKEKDAENNNTYTNINNNFRDNNEPTQESLVSVNILVSF
eukprot:CAMPEP_0196586976 /NCGR_PEP_ID=MMETSP1081-20130531/56085_1 /TAXON_ID=36882 /ORGANISM="Pyramimonas amylifera, Strain CCMP720" /LENGTH=129 /DNA_ID=CAMNT_0041909019 /DNA_START=191 /DNA_END=581 /DNA_ORIENTATION=+